MLCVWVVCVLHVLCFLCVLCDFLLLGLGFICCSFSRSFSWLMGSKEGRCYDEHLVLYTTNESLNITSKLMMYLLYDG